MNENDTFNVLRKPTRARMVQLLNVQLAVGGFDTVRELIAFFAFFAFYNWTIEEYYTAPK